MKCTDCSTENIDSAFYCKNCGHNLLLTQTGTSNTYTNNSSSTNINTAEETDKIVDLFMLIIGAGLLVGLFYFTINMFRFTDIYSFSFVTIITNLITPIVTLIAAVQMPHQKAKTFLFIAFALEILFFAGYRLLQYL